MLVLIRISLVILAASVISGREAWFTSRPLHVRQVLPDRVGIGLHLHLQPGSPAQRRGSNPVRYPGRAWSRTGQRATARAGACLVAVGPAARAMALDVLIIRVPRLT